MHTWLLLLSGEPFFFQVTNDECEPRVLFLFFFFSSVRKRENKMLPGDIIHGSIMPLFA